MSREERKTITIHLYWYHILDDDVVQIGIFTYLFPTHITVTNMNDTHNTTVNCQQKARHPLLHLLQQICHN